MHPQIWASFLDNVTAILIAMAAGFSAGFIVRGWSRRRDRPEPHWKLKLDRTAPPNDWDAVSNRRKEWDR